MSNGADKFKWEDREKAIADVQNHIQGAADTASVYDQFSDIELSKLKEELEQRMGEATLATRTLLNFDLARYRSLRYAVASSYHCQVLGAVNNVRELYEGMRLMYFDTQDPEPPPL